MSYYPVLVNKVYLLPPDYIPDDLEEAGIPFCAPPGSEKRLLRKKASDAAVRLFTQAALDKMGLMGVSGYRSYRRQEELYRDALRRKSSAVAPPGASEHQTGFALPFSVVVLGNFRRFFFLFFRFFFRPSIFPLFTTNF